jgi:5-methylcytosine-specific restriction endonuclease McrA
MLNEPTLVLNRSWIAICTTTVRHALTLAYRRAAKIIATDTFEAHDFESWADLSVMNGEPCIKTVTLSLRIPEVIVLLAYDAIPQREVAFSRKNLYQRDGYRCQYCGRRKASSDLSIDHILPRSRGGRSTWHNCVLACLECNVRKGNRSLEESGMKLIRRPFKPRWSPCLQIKIGHRRASWERFVSDHYWNVELEE